uniref:Uncharacterized protein n=1 Tax=Cannabis sativa TaxID=3483 RepID=A0A803QDN6_CANSA
MLTHLEESTPNIHDYLEDDTVGIATQGTENVLVGENQALGIMDIPSREDVPLPQNALEVPPQEPNAKSNIPS